MLLGIVGLGPPELILIGLVLFLFFGASKLPQAGQALGLGIKNFKKAMNGDETDVTPKKGEKQLKSGSEEDEDEDEKETEKAKG